MNQNYKSYPESNINRPLVRYNSSSPTQPQWDAYPRGQKTRKMLLILLAAIVTILALCAVGASLIAFSAFNSDQDATRLADKPNHSSSETPGQVEPSAFKLGEPARDGKFEFVVTKVKCGVNSIGTGFLKEEAQGEFCLVSMTVKNIGNESQTLEAFNQFAYDAEDKKYEYDPEAGIYVDSENNESILAGINPGNKVKSIIVFDIPKGVKLIKLELHDSTFSQGVIVEI